MRGEPLNDKTMFLMALICHASSNRAICPIGNEDVTFDNAPSLGKYPTSGSGKGAHYQV